MRLLIILSADWNNYQHISTTLNSISESDVTIILEKRRDEQYDALHNIASQKHWNIEIVEIPRLKHLHFYNRIFQSLKYYFKIKEISPDRCIAFIVNENEDDESLAILVKRQRIQVEVHRLYV